MSDLVERLKDVREFINCGHGDVRDVPNDLAVEAAARITELEAENARLREALGNCVSTFKLVERPSFEDPLHGRAVRELGERIGYGALMSSASAAWRKSAETNGYPPGGEFVAGPCFTTVVDTLRRARAALTATGLTEAQLEGLANGTMVCVPVEPMFPIMKGPAVPWALIAPYEAQARENHGQSLKRLAERGGLSVSEAMAIMSEAAFRDRPIKAPTVEQWLDFIAERKQRAAQRAMLAAKEG